MMNYNPMGQLNPYMYNQHPSLFANTLQQNYGNTIPQQTQNQTQQQNITTQPPIMQPNNSKITQVSNKEEATGASVDLIYGTPSFFYNKSNGEIYLKQFDVANGNAIFKVYGEIQPVEEPRTAVNSEIDIKHYDDEFKRLNDGIDSLHRMLAKMQEKKELYEEEYIEPKSNKGKKNA